MILLIFITIMITLRYSGADRRRGGLREGMYVNVPTNWYVDDFGKKVTKDAIPEIMEALEDKHITISADDYDHVFYTVETSYLPESKWPGGQVRSYKRNGRVLLHWEKV